MDTRKIVQDHVKKWEQRCYYNGIPDEAPIEIDDRVPSYKKIVMCILKNDLRKLVAIVKKSEWYNVLKKIELRERGVIIKDKKKDNQLKFRFLKSKIND